MDNKIQHIADEHKRLFKIINFRLPHGFKKIGIIGAVLILFLVFGSKFIRLNTILAKDVLRTLILLFLLLASLSKDKLEDEYNLHIRFQSYVLAVVITATYAIIIPLVAILFDVLITNITKDGNINFHEISAFEVLFILMGMQLLFFETLKRFGRV